MRKFIRDFRSAATAQRDATLNDLTVIKSSEPEVENITLFEAFEWYCPGEQKHWQLLCNALPSLKQLGISMIWLPPGCKASHQNSNGYDAYDLYDLGEFDQKGHVATKWGNKEDLVSCCTKAKELGISLLWDAILNHKAAADYTQAVTAVEVDSLDRRRAICQPKDIEAWLGWDFAGRGGKYSEMKYNAAHFNATDYDSRTSKTGIYRLNDKEWARDVDQENGNFDWLLLNNYDLSRDDVRDDFGHWAQWIGSELGLSGMRFDAAKHMSRAFMKDHAKRLDPKWFLIAEYCTADLRPLIRYIDEMEGRIQLFDFPLHGHLVAASHSRDPDLRLLLKGSLLEQRPGNTVAHVANHDSQERDQDFTTHIAPFFVPMAYALILYHISSKYPCVFFGDLYGVRGPSGPSGPECYGKLSKMILARKLYAYGSQHNYFDDPHCVGFTRIGRQSHVGGAGLAVLINVGSNQASKAMHVGLQHAGEIWSDILGLIQGQVTIDNQGLGFFPIGARMTGIWTNKDALGRGEVDNLTFNDNFYDT